MTPPDPSGVSPAAVGGVVRALHPALPADEIAHLAEPVLSAAAVACDADAIDLLVARGRDFAVVASTSGWDGVARGVTQPRTDAVLRQVAAGASVGWDPDVLGALDGLDLRARGATAALAVPIGGADRILGALVAHREALGRAAASSGGGADAGQRTEARGVRSAVADGDLELPDNAEPTPAARPFDEQEVAAFTAVGLALAVALRESGRLAALRRERGALERGVDRLQRLQTATATLGSSVDEAKVAHAVVGTAVAAVDAAAGSIWIPSDDGEALRLVQAVGYEVGVTERWGQVPLHSALPVTDAYTTGRTVLLRSLEERNRRYPLLAGESSGNETIAAIPLVADGLSLGVLALSLRAQEALGEQDRSFLSGLAQLCAQALDRARLYEAERTARAVAERRLDRLIRVAEAGARLDGAPPGTGRLELLAGLLVPSLADWCALDVLQEPGRLCRVERHADPAMAPTLRWEQEHYPVDLDADAGIGLAIRTGEPQFHPAIDDSLWRAIARDAEHLRVLRKADYRSAIIMPLRAHGRVLGAFTIARGAGWEPFAQDDLEFAAALADRAALALQSAR